MKTIKFLILPVAAAVLAGCSAFGGKDKFDCPNTEVGATCISARQVYEATHVSDRVQPGFKDGKPIEPKGDDTSPQALRLAALDGNGGVTYRPPLPEVDTPLPVRMPAKIMRIRVFPWEDNGRDLNTGGYVYTEIEGRSWTIGEEQVSRVQGNVISPLATNTRNVQGNANPLVVAPQSGSTRQSTQSAPSQTRQMPSLPGAVPPANAK
jgi:conjugal transfer pilus assembly protein TraV